jgi:Ran GTPase-activating protein (RanGAP) involved in mRNA processing and transport
MGTGICMKTKYPKINVEKTKEEKAQNFQDIKTFYDLNKSTLPKKILTLYEEILKTQNVSQELVNLNFVNLQKSSPICLQVILPYFFNVKILKLWKCCLGSAGMKTISLELSELKKLEILSLEDNNLGCDGVCYLAGAFKKLTSLKELWLHINDIGPSGGICLSNSLKHLKNLEKLTLDENSIENKAALKIISSLKTLKNFKELGLGYNCISEDAILNLVVDLASHPLSKLTLCGNNISEESHSRILNILPKTLVIL